ncbi:MAG: IS66 family transposase [Nanoarchaeota archaeon]|nr:IS66 family transposase [Nanoarchaeota archaeon]MBU4455899.1 IS66 family transposase [Nanoarchaeota archaeon]MCG2720236.1 IS66 family transposase [Nanoarchaeota archaeon]
MSRKKELRQLSKNQLIDIIFSLEEKLEKIEQYFKAFDNPHTPSSKKIKKNTKNNNQASNGDKPRFPGKPKGSNGGGIKLPEPDEVVEHKLDFCPISGLPLGKPVGYWKKTTLDLPDKLIKVVEHRIMKYISPITGEIVAANVSLPQGIYGKNLQSIVAMLKNLTNSHEKIADFMRELGAPSFSDAEVQKITDRFSDRLESERESLLEELNKAPYVHADETSFRKDGQNGYVWGVFTKTISILSAAMSRARINIQKLLENFKGVVVVDGYNAYDIFPLKQRCWSHLIREFKNYAKNNGDIGVQYTRLKALYEILKVLNTKPPDEKEIKKAKWILNDIVTCLKVIKGAKGLRTLIKNGGDDWFTALYHEGVPLDNNHAERELRPIVLLRKTIGCYRNEKGKRWIDIVVSVLHTWKLQGRNLFKNLRAIAY